VLTTEPLWLVWHDPVLLSLEVWQVGGLGVQVLLLVTQPCHWLVGQVFVFVCVILPLWFSGQLRVWVCVTGWQVETQLLLLVTHSPQTLEGQLFVLICVMEPLYPLGQLMFWTWVSGWHACGQLGEILG
jgi:hypothetical protein